MMFDYRRTLSLRRAIVLVVVLGLAIPTLAINGYTWFQRYTHDIRHRTDALLERHAETLAAGMQQPLWHGNRGSVTALVAAVMEHNEDVVHIEVRDNALNVLASRERPERRRGHSVTITKPVMVKETTIGSIRIEVASGGLRRAMLDDLGDSMLSVLAQAALSILLILVLLERRFVRPLQKLGAEAERLVTRKLDQPFSWNRADEIGMLSRRMEDTRVSLRRLFDELDHKNRELERDIDKRKRIEQELHEREARFRALVEQSPIAIIEWDRQGLVIEWNAAAERIFGYSRQQAVGRSAGFLMPEGSGTPAHPSRTQGDGELREIVRNRHANGSIIICQWSHSRIDDESGDGDRLLSIAEDITEKQRAEHALSLSEAKFAGAFQCNPDSVSITRMSDWSLIEVNQTFEQVTGYTRAQALGRSPRDLNLWVDIEQLKTLMRQLSERGSARNFEWDMRTRDGKLRKCMLNANLFSAGSERFIMAVMRDVTDRRQLEAQKAEAERALLRLAQGARDIAGASFFDLLVADLASALRTDCAYIGLRVPHAQGHIRTLAAHSNGRPFENFEYSTAHGPCGETLEGGIQILSCGLAQKFPHARWHGERDWQSYAAAPLRDPAGNTIGVLAVLHTDVLGNPDLVRSLLQVFSERASAELERKRAEEELRGSERRFSTFFQSSPVAMYVTHMRGEHLIKDVNHAFEQLFLRTRNEVVGRNSIELGLFCDINDRWSLLAEMEAHGNTQNAREIWMLRGDGTKALVQFSGHSFNLAGELYAILACTDVTDKRRIESELLELNATLEQRVVDRTEELQRANRELASTLETLNMAQEELVRSEKLAALGALVAGIAHELNTPIGNSLMVASTLVDQTRVLNRDYREHGLKRSALEAYLGDAAHAGDILLRNLQRAANLVTGFKQVAIDQTSSHRRKFSVAEVVAEIMLTLSPSLKKTGFVFRQQVPNNLEMDSYPGPLGQVITNLVNNALLHGFEGRQTGTVSIIALPSAEGWIDLSVTDDGVGISAANLNRIFDPFFTTKLGAGGSGLGLNIAHNIVTGVLGGRLRVNSEPGAGTAFTLALPLVAPVRATEGRSDEQAGFAISSG